ncbi:hypothetical protein [Streptomyces sp. 2A115]|uniref:hypothetical protein n=1 Tax=Streptomyces sp. 2A115 TaxID=3457439 RepID=UPI003FD1C808
MNHGPSENSGPGASGFSDKEATGREPVRSGGLSSVGLGTEESDLDALGSDELALRRLMHQAVEEIEPTDGTLEHLRRAVPARRARKRQAVVGMAAAALFIGTAVPALVAVSHSSGSDADPSVVGHSSQTPGEKSEDGGEATAGSSSGSSADKSKGKDKGDKKDDKGQGKETSSGTTGSEPTPTIASAPACTSTQLGSVSGSAGSPDAGGAVYGSFSVANVSTASCTVTGGGSVSVTAQGAADQAKLGTSLHAAGDAAASLPDPSTYASSLVLQPGAAYKVEFAWVPSETCPTSGGGGSADGGSGGEPSTDPTPSDDTGGDSGGTSSEGTKGTGGETTQLMKRDGVADGSVVVSYTAEGGAPTTSTTVSNACAGTVYMTGALAGA